MKQKFVLDTSIFVNPDAARFFGSDPTDSWHNFLTALSSHTSIEAFMPPSIYDELSSFIDESKIPKSLLLKIEKKPPKKHELKIPGIFIYHLVEDMRDRIDRGLRLAERHVRESLEVPAPEQTPTSKEVRGDAGAISRLRESYRRIMREGMLDSKADVDLLLLAYEIEATLVSADLGVVQWAENLGISIMTPSHFSELVQGKPHPAA